MGRFMIPVCCICGESGLKWDADWEYIDFCPKHAHPLKRNNMEKIPTAKDWLDLQPFVKKWIDGLTNIEVCAADEVVRLLEEYSVLKAKFHVKAALKAAYDHQEIEQHKKEDKYDYPSKEHFRATERSILSAYPESNIV